MLAARLSVARLKPLLSGDTELRDTTPAGLGEPVDTLDLQSRCLPMEGPSEAEQPEGAEEAEPVKPRGFDRKCVSRGALKYKVCQSRGHLEADVCQPREPSEAEFVQPRDLQKKS